MDTTTITCDVCGEELDWAPDNRLLHRIDGDGYLHVVVGEPTPEEEP